MVVLLAQVVATPTTTSTTRVYSTDFENVTKKDANRFNMGIDNWFEFQGDGGAVDAGIG